MNFRKVTVLISEIKHLDGHQDLSIDVYHDELIELLKANGQSPKEIASFIAKSDNYDRQDAFKIWQKLTHWRNEFIKTKEDVFRRLHKDYLDNFRKWAKPRSLPR